MIRIPTHTAQCEWSIIQVAGRDARLPAASDQRTGIGNLSLIYRHAAASYHHYSLLEYLLSVGGDINLPDDEGETPLFTVENVEAAKWLIEHGADPARTNEEGQTVCQEIPPFMLEHAHRKHSFIRTAGS